MYYIYIDESGIHKQVDHSTYVLAFVKIEDHNFLEEKIKQIEKKLGIEYFHWSKTVWKVKKLFMEEALKLNFAAKIAVIKNPIHPAKEMERILSHLIIEKNIKNIYIDGRKPRWYENKIKKILRDKGILVRKLKTVNDKQYAGIRLADMIAGLSRSYYDKKNLSKISVFFKKLKKKIIIVIQK